MSNVCHVTAIISVVQVMYMSQSHCICFKSHLIYLCTLVACFAKTISKKGDTKFASANIASRERAQFREYRKRNRAKSAERTGKKRLRQDSIDGLHAVRRRGPRTVKSTVSIGKKDVV